MSRIKASAVVSRQLPEFVREDYPTFVAFVEAYYEYLQAQGVDFSNIRDIDKTLEDFIVQFKRELAHNLPNIVEDERFLLQRIKDHYLAKGSEASYKLLFRLLFGKNVELIYPGRSLLRASDGRWNQEISLFAKVDFGDPEAVVGRLVDITTPTRVLRVLVDRRQDVIGEVDRIVALGGDIFEFFLDKRFFGLVSPGDTIRFKDEFQATILTSTTNIKIVQPGRNFRVGQVFELISRTGTGALMKVTAVDSNGGIKYAEIIKFGIGYTADFSVSVLASNSVTATTVGELTSSSSRSGDDLFLNDRTLGSNEEGFINRADMFDFNYVDGAYAGTTVREFSLNFRNAQTDAQDPAVIEVKLGALSRYPGYFETNNGFLDDSIFIQDSKFYQAFSYVIKIDERLSSYASAVKTMVHPAGMALFGEFQITNNIDLSIFLESLVKSLGITLESETITQTDSVTLEFEKVLSSSIVTPPDVLRYDISKPLFTLLDTPVDNETRLFTKNISVATGFTLEQFELDDSVFTKSTGKQLLTVYSGMTDGITLRTIEKSLLSTPTILETPFITTNKYLETTSVDTFIDEGYVGFNPFAGQDYFSQEYSVGSRASTF
jgi:hypothetical protein